MKIADRIRLSHFVLAAAVLFVGLIGYIAVDQVTRQYDRALQQTMPVVDALQDARFHAVRVGAVAFEMQLGPRHQAAEARMQLAAPGEDSLLDVFAALDAQLHRYRLLATAYFPAEQAVASHLDAEALLLRAVLDRLVAVPGGSPAGDEALVEVEAAVGRLTALIRDALTAEQRELVEYQEAITVLRRVTLWTVAVLTLGAFGLALLVAVLASRRLARPIVELRDTARRFARRDLAARATPRSSDEVGELAQTFNEMAAALGETMVSRDYLENILAQLSEGVLVVDAAGRIQRANAAAEALLPRREGGLVGRHAGEAIGELFGDESRWPQPGQRVELAFEQPPGPPRYLEAALAELVDHGRPAGAVITLHDVSALKRAEYEMRQRADQLAAASRQPGAARERTPLAE